MKHPIRAMDSPWRALGVFLGLGLAFVLLDAAYVASVSGVSMSEALLSPSGESTFVRVIVLVLIVVGVIFLELIRTRYRYASQELETERQRLQTMYEKNPSPVITLDRDLTVSYANEKVASVVGSDVATIVGQKCHKAIVGLEEPCDGCLADQVFRTGKPQSRIKHETTTAGRENWLSQVWYPLYDGEGEIESVVEVASDVSGLKLDPLTSLPNRILLRDRMDVALASARRHGQAVAVLFMDIDGFKEINDTLGHAAGDAVLAGLAERLRGIVRQDETFARVGGDEFVLLLPAVDSVESAERMAGRIIDHLDAPFVWDGHHMRVSASIGIALFAGDAETAEGLLERADAAMYVAKSEGGGRHEIAGV